MTAGARREPALGRTEPLLCRGLHGRAGRGVCRRSLDLASGQYAVVEKNLDFTLVLWGRSGNTASASLSPAVCAEKRVPGFSAGSAMGRQYRSPAYTADVAGESRKTLKVPRTDPYVAAATPASWRT